MRLLPVHAAGHVGEIVGVLEAVVLTVVISVDKIRCGSSCSSRPNSMRSSGDMWAKASRLESQ